ncbi:hypothetical protein BDW69DRAFT_12263 [Aspergillus filifer]
MFGKSIENYGQDNAHLVAHFSDGSSDTFDLLVGADSQETDSNIRDSYFRHGRSIVMRRSPNPTVTEVLFILRETSNELLTVSYQSRTLSVPAGMDGSKQQYLGRPRYSVCSGWCDRSTSCRSFAGVHRIRGFSMTVHTRWSIEQRSPGPSLRLAMPDSRWGVANFSLHCQGDLSFSHT